MINPDPLDYFLEQNKNSEKVDKLRSDCDFNVLMTFRHRLAVITQTSPEILAIVNNLSQVTKTHFLEEENKIINGLIKYIRKPPKSRSRYVLLDKQPTKLPVYSAGSFALNKDGTSQVWYLIFMADKHNRTNLLEYAIIKSRRVVRLVLGAKMFSLADACDSTIVQLFLLVIHTI